MNFYNFYNELKKLGFRKMKPTKLTKSNEGKFQGATPEEKLRTVYTWIEEPMYKEGEKRVVIHTFKLRLDGDRCLYINITKTRYQTILSESNKENKHLGGSVNQDGFRDTWSDFGFRDTSWSDFDPNFWKTILKEVPKDVLREIRLKQLFKSKKRN